MRESITNFFEFNMPFERLSVPQITFSSVLDIAILAFIMYRVLMQIKQNRAGIIFRGIIMLMLVVGVAFLLQLQTILWIITNAFSAGIIAIIVLYQPELRKMLEKIGKGTATGLFPYFDNGGDIKEQTVDAVITAAAKMSRVRTGALMAIQREVPLGDFMEHGIMIDAVVTAELLINIFENKTPLHDGAVIISGNRVVAATCLLPLTKNDLSHDLGTRHRAAVGASEVSDAYVVVISEETGHISIAHEGRLYRNVSTDEMYEMLSQTKKVTKPAKGRKRK